MSVGLYTLRLLMQLLLVTVYVQGMHTYIDSVPRPVLWPVCYTTQYLGPARRHWLCLSAHHTMLLSRIVAVFSTYTNEGSHIQLSLHASLHDPMHPLYGGNSMICRGYTTSCSSSGGYLHSIGSQYPTNTHAGAPTHTHACMLPYKDTMVLGPIMVPMLSW